MTRLKSHSPLLSQYPGHLVDIFTLFFLSFPFNQDSPKKKTSPSTSLYKAFSKSVAKCNSVLKEKSVVTGLYLPKLCGHLVCDEIKERKKGKFVIVSLQFFSPTIVLPLNQRTGQFVFW